jgi:hypothetical protein
VAVAFFAASGVLEFGLSVAELEAPAPWEVWDAFVRGAMHGLLALGLWRRLAVCRTIALVYCLAALVTYGVVLGLAVAQAPVRFPDSVRVQSLFQVPSCALLLPFLRSRAAAALFPRVLFARHRR